jgi:hypothetical protein
LIVPVETATLSFCVAATGPDLRLVVRLDDTVVYDGYPEGQPEKISHEFADLDDQDHTLVFEMRGKMPVHTQVADTGEILQDRVIEISDVAFDDILLSHMFTEQCQYHHNNNDITDPVIDQFYGVMGCNGRVEMRFSTPIYLWLLENM